MGLQKKKMKYSLCTALILNLVHRESRSFSEFSGDGDPPPLTLNCFIFFILQLSLFSHQHVPAMEGQCYALSPGKVPDNDKLLTFIIWLRTVFLQLKTQVSHYSFQ